MALADGDTIKFLSVSTLQFVRPKDDGQHLSVATMGPDPVNLMVKFRLEKPSTVTGMWHIKCLTTEKYWQVKPVQSGSIPWITADADRPNENNCLASTLFSIEFFGDGPTTTIRLRHQYLKSYARVYDDSQTFPYCLCALTEKIDKDSKDVFVYYISK